MSYTSPRAPLGQRCHATIAVTIAKPREVTLCTAWLPGFALVCHECGTPSPQARIAALVDNPERFPVVQGDIARTIAKATHNGARRGGGR